MLMQRRMESTLTALLAAEAEAGEIIEKAEQEVREAREQSRKAVQDIVNEAKAKEEQEATRILEEAKNEAEKTRKAILDDAEKEAQNWEILYQKNRDEAMRFIFESINSADLK